MTDRNEIRRHPDGSIDIGHHLAKGLDCRSRAAHVGARTVTGQAWRRVSGLAAVLAFVGTIGMQARTKATSAQASPPILVPGLDD